MEKNKEYWDQAIFELYPNVNVIYGDVPKDINKNPVVYDSDKVNQRAFELESNDISIAESKEAIRASALQKLVENAGLTVEEASELVKL